MYKRLQGTRIDKGDKVIFKTTKTILAWMARLQAQADLPKGKRDDFGVITKQITSLLYYRNILTEKTLSEVI